MIRPAHDEDLAALMSLEVELFGTGAWSEAGVRSEIEAGRVLVSEAGDSEVGGYVVTSVAGDVADLRRVGVRPDHQRRGLGGILLSAAIESVDAERMLLEVSDRNDAARALYHGHGFEVIDRRRAYYPDGSDALVMSRRIERG